MSTIAEQWLTDEWEGILGILARLGIPSFYPLDDYGRLTGQAGKTTYSLGKISRLLADAHFSYRDGSVQMMWISTSLRGGTYLYRRKQDDSSN